MGQYYDNEDRPKKVYPPDPIFEEGEVVNFEVERCNELTATDKPRTYIVKAIALNTIHKGLTKSLFIKDPTDKLSYKLPVWVKKDNEKILEILGNNETDPAGRQFLATAKKPREYNGKTYQDFTEYRAVNVVKNTNTVKNVTSELEDLPF